MKDENHADFLVKVPTQFLSPHFSELNFVHPDRDVDLFQPVAPRMD